jgi:hypothetical protein
MSLKLGSVHNRQEEERRIREEEMLRQREIEEQMRRKREEAYRSGNFMDNVSYSAQVIIQPFRP